MKLIAVKMALAAVILMVIGTGAVAHAQNWTQHIDWAATNADAGGSVDCPAAYAQMGEWPAVIAGGRSMVINDALFAAYSGNVGRAYSLVLMTQCHNPGAQQELLQAGQNGVIQYLVENWTPNGVSSEVITQGVLLAGKVLAGSN